MFAVSENGSIPDISAMTAAKTTWAWWMPWYQTWNGGFVNKTSNEEWHKCMNDPRVVTLDDLEGGWEAYAARIPAITSSAAADHRIFDLQGRILTHKPSKGLYIQNGKKIMAK